MDTFRMDKRFGLDTRFGLPGILFDVMIDGVVYQQNGGSIGRHGIWYVCFNHTEGRYMAHTESYRAALMQPIHTGEIRYIG